MNKLFIGTALAIVLSAGAANAAALVVLGPTGSNTGAFDNNPVGATSGTTTFDGLLTTWSITGSGPATVVDTSVTSHYLAPLGDTSNYIYATSEGGGNDVNLSWGTTVDRISFLWGSPDDSPNDGNIVTLSNGDTITGSQVLALTGTASGDNTGSTWVTITDTRGFTGFTASSNNVAFEFDAAVPEPSTWAMMGLGFAGLAFAGFRARKTSVSIA